ncbi:17_t:CDS:1, partial [Cetraspora pellucida]
DLAKKTELKIEDVLIDLTNIRGHQFDDDKIKKILAYSVVIPCKRCVFKDHTVTICRKFSKEEENVCILSQNAEESIIYNTGNYRLFIIVDYMNFLYQAHLNNNDILDNDKIKLGTLFGQLNSGYPVYFTKFEVEVAYAPTLENYKNLSMFAENISDRILEKFKASQNIEPKEEEDE